MHTPGHLMLACSATLLITACGSTSNPPVRAGDAQTADQLFAAAIAAWSSVRSVRETVAGSDANGSAAIVIDETQSEAHMTLAAGGALSEAIIVGGRVYLGAEGVFHEVTPDIAPIWQVFLPATQASCKAKQHGKLSLGPTSTIRGRTVVQIKDDGTGPGGQAGSLYVAVGGPPLPVRSVQAGPAAPGGYPECGTTTGMGKSGEIDFEYAAPPVTVTAPPVVSPTPVGANTPV